MAKILEIPKMANPDNNIFCAGCAHPVIAKLIMSVIEELGIQEVIGVNAVGCACNMSRFFGCDWVQAQHGRAAAVAVGVKAIRPNAFVFTYQGDGDAAAIGMSETLYAAKRNDNITTFFVNNGVFGMTGGQLAPTSIEGQITKTSKYGCDYKRVGAPIKLAEQQAGFQVSYVARGNTSSFKEIQKLRRYIKKAVEAQFNSDGYSFVEILGQCPTNWNLMPAASLERLEKEAMPVFPCGEFVVEGRKKA